MEPYPTTLPDLCIIEWVCGVKRTMPGGEIVTCTKPPHGKNAGDIMTDHLDATKAWAWSEYPC